MTIYDREKIKHLVSELNEAVETMRQEPEDGHAWSWDDEHAAGLNLADAAEALIMALPTVVWPEAWFQVKSAGQPSDRPVSRYEERLVDELLEQLGL
ncbi:hypothetical protein [Streptomyces sp. CC77]|uniref:hypothetical protein n=1 Tax=Streptomyces sp. CC77 TaxID=1906739 RepID=UPI0008DE5970|nr:hypothetical protein [Streptomyces sp. CC77]OII68295.1 hypothetical protein BJP39_00615 [Streptomyces sp. CC77]